MEAVLNCSLSFYFYRVKHPPPRVSLSLGSRNETPDSLWRQWWSRVEVLAAQVICCWLTLRYLGEAIRCGGLSGGGRSDGAAYCWLAAAAAAAGWWRRCTSWTPWQSGPASESSGVCSGGPSGRSKQAAGQTHTYTHSFLETITLSATRWQCGHTLLEGNKPDSENFDL